MRCLPWSKTETTRALYWLSLLSPHPSQPSSICWLDFRPTRVNSPSTPHPHTSPKMPWEGSEVTSSSAAPCLFLDGFPDIFSCLIFLLCLWSHLPSLMLQTPPLLLRVPGLHAFSFCPRLSMETHPQPDSTSTSVSDSRCRVCHREQRGSGEGHSGDHIQAWLLTEGLWASFT